MAVVRTSMRSSLLVVCLTLAAVALNCSAKPAPPDYPVWPDQFYIDFTVYVEQYGSDWSSVGYLAYNWMQKAFKGTYTDWCLPLFGDTSGKSLDNYTCSFVAINGNMYFVNDSSSSSWDTADCCMFEKGLAAVAPDWVKNDQYNGTDTIRNQLVDVWWFPGTSDPNMPCYGYWNVRKTNTPIRFFGLSSLGPTILDYFNYKPGSVTNIVLPKTNCEKECEPPVKKLRRRNQKYLASQQQDIRSMWPNWPSCWLLYSIYVYIIV